MSTGGSLKSAGSHGTSVLQSLTFTFTPSADKLGFGVVEDTFWRVVVLAFGEFMAAQFDIRSL